MKWLLILSVVVASSTCLHALDMDELPFEGKLRNQTQTYTLWSISLGPSYLAGSSRMLYTLGGGRHWNVRDYAELSAGVKIGMAGISDMVGELNLGGSYYPLTSDITPFVGIQFGVGFLNREPTALGGGFTTSMRAGARFFRTATTQFEASFYHTWLLGSGIDDARFYGFLVGILF